MKTTSKYTCNELVKLLINHDVHKVVVSPGSRNTPIIMALARNPQIEIISAIDERVAAFIGLGYAVQSAKPVALVCTSGTAVLNFAPAVAEAFYRQVPLIVISADRPAEWIDQDDSQTIRQSGILDNIVKESCSLPGDAFTETTKWYVNRKINDAVITAKSTPTGPVHININIDAPLETETEMTTRDVRIINTYHPEPQFTDNEAKRFAQTIASTQKVMIIAGFMEPNPELAAALAKLAEYNNIIILHEAQSNLHLNGSDKFIYKIDSTLAAIIHGKKHEKIDEFYPDLVISIGGSLLSRMVKSFLREAPTTKHWHLGAQPWSVDCFTHLYLRIEMPAAKFLCVIANNMPKSIVNSSYAGLFNQASESAKAFDYQYGEDAMWSDFKAMRMIIEKIPNNVNVHFSNGTAIRYAQLCEYGHVNRINCNRGVSGIDGCTSTAIGASMAYDGQTLLITGDMSAQYDMGALAVDSVPDRFKMIVLNNNGGGIFRFIKSTRNLPELDTYISPKVHLPLKQLASGFGFDYLHASNSESLKSALDKLFTTNKKTILEVETEADESAWILTEYFEQKRK